MVCLTECIIKGELGEFAEANAQRIGHGKEITSLASNVGTEDQIQLLVGTEDRRVLSFTLDFNAKLIPIFSVALNNTIPATVAFAENNEDILVFGLKDGNV